VKLADAIKLVRSMKVSHAQKFAQHVVPEVVRPARVIWNQAIGGVFLLFALSFTGYAITQSRNPAAMIGGIFLGLVMAFFCVTSFLKARQISRR
jgi:ABC-type dipeptide/oligopeptide/nickel transport system permease subunit